MRRLLNLIVRAMLLVPLCGIAALAQTPTYHLGRAPSGEEIRAWDISILPDGKGLPPGSGTAKEGAKIYTQWCAMCHGQTGAEGQPVASTLRHGIPLAGGRGTINTLTPVKTVGSFWPFAPPIWGYISQAMPWMSPGRLKPDEVYALTAYLLFKSDIIKEDDVMDAQSLSKVQMPNRDGFIPANPDGWKGSSGNRDAW
jgi:mono/diheme cytochrome c family protein